MQAALPSFSTSSTCLAALGAAASVALIKLVSSALSSCLILCIGAAPTSQVQGDEQHADTGGVRRLSKHATSTASV